MKILDIIIMKYPRHQFIIISQLFGHTHLKQFSFIFDIFNFLIRDIFFCRFDEKLFEQDIL